jgi:antitoxin component of MazEF toxin-antitoxin module
MQVEVVKWGNSSAVRLPAALLKEANIGLGDRLNLKTENGVLVLEPAVLTYNLSAMLALITPDNCHHSLVTAIGDEPAGREVW